MLSATTSPDVGPSALAPSSPACVNATFVTLLTGVRYAAAAACLPKQLRFVNSTCPLLLVYNDADSSLPLPMLRDAYGAHRMLPLRRLKARYNRTRHARHEAPPVSGAGRRLFATAAEAANTHQKLWLWALPIKGRAVFLDIDILLFRNIDALLEIAPTPQTDGRPGLGAVTCKSKYGERYFNSGVLVFTPSLRALEQLLMYQHFASGLWHGHVPHLGDAWPNICAPIDDPFRAVRMFPNSSRPLGECRNRHGPGRQPGMMSKACESKLTDQSIFNSVFTRHTAIPRSFNLAAGNVDEPTNRIMHFVGEPKPWSDNPFSGRSSEPLRRHATQEWRRRCLPA